MRALIGLQKRASCYDYIVSLFPVWILSFSLGVIYSIIIIIYSAITGNDVSNSVQQILMMYIITYINIFIRYVATLIREYRRVHCDARIFIWIFIWPLIDIIMDFIRFLALFVPLKWRVIPRYDQREIDEIYKIKNIAEYVGFKKTRGAKDGDSI